MKEWRVTRISIIGQNASHELANKLDEISQGGWDIDGMEIMGVERDRMIIISSREKEEEIKELFDPEEFIP